MINEKHGTTDFADYTDNLKRLFWKLKLKKCFTKEDEAQIINSLKISRHKIGLLINFGEQSLRFKRFIN